MSKGLGDWATDKKQFDENFERIDWLQARATLKAWRAAGSPEPITEKVLRAAVHVITGESTPEGKCE